MLNVFVSQLEPYDRLLSVCNLGCVSSTILDTNRNSQYNYSIIYHSFEAAKDIKDIEMEYRKKCLSLP